MKKYFKKIKFPCLKTREGRISLYVLLLTYIIGILSYFGFAVILVLLFNLKNDDSGYHSIYLLFYGILLIPFIIISTIGYTSKAFRGFIRQFEYGLKDIFTKEINNNNKNKLCIYFNRFLKFIKSNINLL